LRLLAINVHAVWFAMNLMPELVFIGALLACTMVADSDDGWRGGAIAGILGGAAYLLKSAALPLLITSPLVFLVIFRPSCSITRTAPAWLASTGGSRILVRGTA
jgi:hypothetical protein